jgi:hypothetical protein
MAIRIKSQKDYLLTEVCIELPCSLDELDYLMKTSRGSGKIVAVYQQGGIYGINVEQRTRIRESVTQKVRELVGVETEEFNGE